MTYSEALFFTSKCLTLGLYPERIPEIRAEIRSGSIEWEQVVWVSTGQFVFAALYLQLKRAGLLPELPEDLVEYMEEFTTKNRERNKQIIEEAFEINSLLNKNNITPVFLKGVAHLLDGLYEDIGERMVGDIDFLVNRNELFLAAEALMKLGYKPLGKIDQNYLRQAKHYPRMTNNQRTTAIEIHFEILYYPNSKALDCKSLIAHKKVAKSVSSMYVLSDDHQIIQNILNVQLNDLGYYYGQSFLRQSYDLLLLSQRANPLSVIIGFKKFFNLMNSNLALVNKIFNNPVSISYKNNLQTKIFIRRCLSHLHYPLLARFSHFVLYLANRFFNQALFLISLLYNGNARKSFYARLSDPKWYGAHIRSYKANI